MFTFKHSRTVATGALLFSAVLSFAAATILLAQQPQGTAASISAPAEPAPVASTAATTPAPHASALFATTTADAPTIAAAQSEHAKAMSSNDNHTIVVSTLVLVLGVVILVLLIA